MTGRRRIVATVAWAAVLGALLAVPLGGQQRLSIELWVSVALVWIAWSLTLRLLDTAPLIPARLRTPWRLPPKPEEIRTRLPRNLVALEGTMISARDNGRAYALRLRPRLRRVAGHFLAVNHGVAPGDAATVLGDHTWLIEGGAVGHDERSPTAAEIDRLLDLVLAETDRGDGGGATDG